MISAAEFAAYNRAVAKIGDRAASDVEAAVLAWCRAHEGATVAEKREAAKLIMEGFVQGYDDVAAEFAAQWYDDLAERNGARLQQAVTMTTYRPESVDTVARYQAKKLVKGGDAAFARACGEYARNDAFRSLNETIISNVGRDKDRGVRFARVPTGFETCTFCIMLASRGAVYHTRKSAGEFKHFHRHCDCKVVPGFEDDPDAELVEGVRPEELRERWWQLEKVDATAGLSAAEREELRRKVMEGGELPENVRKTNPAAHMRKVGHKSSGWMSAATRLNAEIKANGFANAEEFYEYLRTRRTRAETAEAVKLAEEVLGNADATPTLRDVVRSHLRPSIEANITHGEIAAREVAPTSAEVRYWSSGERRNWHAKEHAAEYGIDYRSKAGQDEYDRILSEVIDEADDVAFVDDIRGQNGQRCAVYFRGGDIAVVNLDKKVRVSLFKYEEGYSDYYTSLWNKVRK